MHLNYLKGLWKQISGPHLQSFWLGRLEWSPRICIFNKVSGDDDGPETTLWDPQLQSVDNYKEHLSQRRLQRRERANGLLIFYLFLCSQAFEYYELFFSNEAVKASSGLNDHGSQATSVLWTNWAEEHVIKQHQPSSACSLHCSGLRKSHKSLLETSALALSCPAASRINSMILHVLKVSWHLGSDTDGLCVLRELSPFWTSVLLPIKWEQWWP